MISSPALLFAFVYLNFRNIQWYRDFVLAILAFLTSLYTPTSGGYHANSQTAQF